MPSSSPSIPAARPIVIQQPAPSPVQPVTRATTPKPQPEVQAESVAQLTQKTKRKKSGGRAATFLTGGAGVPSKLGVDESISRPGATKLG